VEQAVVHTASSNFLFQITLLAKLSLLYFILTSSSSICNIIPGYKFRKRIKIAFMLALVLFPDNSSLVHHQHLHTVTCALCSEGEREIPKQRYPGVESEKESVPVASNSVGTDSPQPG